MDSRRIGFIIGLVAIATTVILPPPAAMPGQAWIMAGLVVWMAAWWMTEAIPLTATALLPFLVMPFAGVMTAKNAAAAYYSPILFLILGGAFIAIAIERTGLHRRLAVLILDRVGSKGDASRVLFAFMLTTGILSMAISNTSSALIMMPMALAVIAGCGLGEDDREGLAGALPIGIAFAASIGGLGTIVGSPTNAIAVGLLDKMLGLRIGFAQWSSFGVPVVLLGLPLAAFIIGRVQKLKKLSRRSYCCARGGLHERRMDKARAAAASADLRHVPAVDDQPLDRRLPARRFADRRDDRGGSRHSAFHYTRRHRTAAPDLEGSRPRAVGRHHDVRRRPRPCRRDGPIGTGNVARQFTAAAGQRAAAGRGARRSSPWSS